MSKSFNSQPITYIMNIIGNTNGKILIDSNLIRYFNNINNELQLSDIKSKEVLECKAKLIINSLINCYSIETPLIKFIIKIDRISFNTEEKSPLNHLGWDTVSLDTNMDTVIIYDHTTEDFIIYCNINVDKALQPIIKYIRRIDNNLLLKFLIYSLDKHKVSYKNNYTYIDLV